MIQLFLDPNLPYKRLLDLAAGERRFFDFLNSDLDTGSLVNCKLDFTVGAFAEVAFFGLDEFQVVLGQILQQGLQSLLFHGERTLIVRILDERG